uniref:Uncharacterized protein n=1 Tax=Felis catus TaxID=9685 RepID=A0ABI7XXU5_FELCA
MSDSTWLTSEICNPLAVGQYVNNCSNDRAANVCYQEFDVPAVFPIELKQYLPNIAYSCDKQRLVFSYPLCSAVLKKHVYSRVPGWLSWLSIWLLISAQVMISRFVGSSPT